MSELPATSCTSTIICPSETENQYAALISEFSHEIRNSLTLVNSSLQLLEKECPAVLQSDLWPQISQDMADTFQLLRKMSVRKSTRVLCKHTVPMMGFLQKTAASAAPALEERGIHFSSEFDDSVARLSCSQDECSIKEVLVNLLFNAADAVSETPGTRRVTLSAGANGDFLCIHITDNGPGIPQEYMDTLFDPFVTHKKSGTGLGLYVVRTVVAQHGGSISVQTNPCPPGTFTDFCIRLPIVKA